MTSDIRQKLDKITDTMWSGGLANPITYVEQLSYLLYLKLLDEAENQHSQAELLGITLDRPTLFPAQAKRYRWSEWRFKSGNELLDFVADEVFPYMASLVREAPGVATFFADARFQFEDAHVFKEVVDILDTFQFAKLGPDVKGDIFEYQLLKLQNQAKSDLGQFRTPRQLRQFMVQLVDPDIGDSIYDPACGTGGFLVEALDHILAKYSTTTRTIPIYGEGWEEKQNFKSADEALEKIPNLQTYQRGIGDRLAKDDWKKLEASLYGHDVSGQMVRVALMNLVLHVVPEGLLFGSTGAHVELRKKLVTDFDLHAVISLPAGVFKPYAGVKTSVLVFSKGSVGVPPTSSNNDRKVLFYEVKNDGYDPDKVSGGGRVETPNENGIPALLTTWNDYKSSNFKTPLGPEANTLLEADAEEPACWWASLEKIAESDFNLSAGAYKPNQASSAGNENPITLIDELTNFEQSILSGLKKLKLSISE